jgi:predicted O-methyltransferase YrrM
MTDRPHGPTTIAAAPVLTEAATLLLGLIATGKEVFEFGSGGSTLWLAARTTRLESVEDDARWHAAVTEALLDRGYPGVQVRLVETAAIPDAIEDTGEWDVVFVDCMTHPERRRSIVLGASHVKPGGWLVADDYDFPKVKQSVEELRAAGWDVAVVAGVKLHPNRRVLATTATAFCRRTDGHYQQREG